MSKKLVIREEDNGNLYRSNGATVDDVGRDCILDDERLWDEYVRACKVVGGVHGKILDALRPPRAGEFKP